MRAQSAPNIFTLSYDVRSGIVDVPNEGKKIKEDADTDEKNPKQKTKCNAPTTMQ
jgi:hypothetical protein